MQDLPSVFAVSNLRKKCIYLQKMESFTIRVKKKTRHQKNLSRFDKFTNIMNYLSDTHCNIILPNVFALQLSAQRSILHYATCKFYCIRTDFIVRKLSVNNI